MATQYLVAAPLKSLFTDPKKFRSIFFGSIYIGEVDQDPENPSNQQQVYVIDESGSPVPVSQPVKIGPGGYAEYGGSGPSKFVCDRPYSMVVLDKNGGEVWRIPDIRTVDIDSAYQFFSTKYRIETTVSEIQAGGFSIIPTYFSLTDRGNAKFVLQAGGNPNGYDVIDAGNGNTAVLQHSNEISVVWTGFVDDYNPDTGEGTDNYDAIMAAVNLLKQPKLEFSPTRYVYGGGKVLLPPALCKITKPIKLTYGAWLSGMGRGATRLIQHTAGEDAINIVRDAGPANYYTVSDVVISDITIESGINGADAGISTRDETNCWSISNCSFSNLDITGFNVGIHLFGGWNNSFSDIEISGKERYSDGIIGIIAETCTGGNSYGPTGKLRSYTDAAGGFSSNVFENVTCININRVGVIIRAVSLSHAYSNTFNGCNIEAIHFNTESPLTYEPYTDRISYGSNPVVTVWDGRPVGMLGIGRVIGTTYNGGGYIEEFYSLTGGVSNSDGTGFIWDDYGIEFSPDVSKNYNNRVQGTFFNSDVSRPVHYGRCNYSGTEQNTYLIASGNGFYRELKSRGIYSQNESAQNESGSPKNVPFDFVNFSDERVHDLSDYATGTGNNFFGDGIQAKESDSLTFRRNEQWKVGGGKRKFAQNVQVVGGALVENEYSEVTPDGLGKHGTKGFPKNTGTATIPSGTSGSYTVTQATRSDNNSPTFITVLTNGSGISRINIIERTSETGFKIYFDGTTIVDTQISYMHVNI